MIKIRKFNEWVALKEGDGLKLPSDKMRTVRLELNAPGETNLAVKQDGKWTYLCTFQGNEILELGWSGDLELKADGPIWYYTPERDKRHITVENPVVFTRILNRRKRNPEMEALMYKLQENMQSRMDAQIQEIDRKYGERVSQELKRAQKARPLGVKPDDKSTRNDGDAGQEPEAAQVAGDAEDVEKAPGGAKSPGAAVKPKSGKGGASPD